MKKIILYIISTTLIPLTTAFAVSGDNATFQFLPLNGKEGENEVKLVVNTDSALINHLIFDILDTARSTFFEITGSNDPITFTLSGQSVLGTETPFTTVSGDYGYDLASANPANTGAYSALHFATLIADKNLPTGAGGTLAFDTDTAIYVNGNRKGTFLNNYVVLPNVAPIISLPKIEGNDISDSITAPSALTPTPTGFRQGVSVTPNFSYSVSDDTDASVIRQMKLFKKLDGNLWGYVATATYTKTYARSGSTMTFNYTLTSGEKLDYASYYKLQFIAIDDQGASDTDTYYFSTIGDDEAPTQVPKSKMTFLSESNDRTDIISQITFSRSTDNNNVENYYLWSKSYLIEKNIIDEEGERSLTLDSDLNDSVSDEEFNNALRELVRDEKYLKKISDNTAILSPFFRITGQDIDNYDDMGTPDRADDIYYIPDSLASEILYIVAADDATLANGDPFENFSNFQIVLKDGDIFGAEQQLMTTTGLVEFITGDGSLDVWDSIYLYRNIIGRSSEFPMLVPDMIGSTTFDYPINISTSGALIQTTYGYGY